VDALTDQSERTRKDNPGCAVFWVIHFKPGLAGDLPLRLCGDDILGAAAAAAKEAGVAGLLCGHTHEKSDQVDFNGLPVYLCGTSAQFHAEEGNYINVITVDVDKANGTCDVDFKAFVFDNAQGYVSA
jgi:hypothetical protein